MAKRLAFLNNWTSIFLATVERGGNALPHPATIFAVLAGVIVVLSGIAASTGLEVVHPGTGETIRPVSLLTVDGLHRILVEMVTNFTSFAPLGTVLVAMLGIGVMEASGLIAAALRLLVLSAPKRLLTFVIVFSGVLSNTASEVGYVLLVPLGGIIFLGAGRHPIAGLAAAFAGVLQRNPWARQCKNFRADQRVIYDDIGGGEAVRCGQGQQRRIAGPRPGQPNGSGHEFW